MSSNAAYVSTASARGSAWWPRSRRCGAAGARAPGPARGPRAAARSPAAARPAPRPPRGGRVRHDQRDDRQPSPAASRSAPTRGRAAAAARARARARPRLPSGAAAARRGAAAAMPLRPPRRSSWSRTPSAPARAHVGDRVRGHLPDQRRRELLGGRGSRRRRERGVPSRIPLRSARTAAAAASQAGHVQQRAQPPEQPVLAAQHLRRRRARARTRRRADRRAGAGPRPRGSRSSRASEPRPRASMAARTFAACPIARNSPTNAAARSPYMRTVTPRWRSSRRLARARQEAARPRPGPRPAPGSARSRAGPSGSSASAASSPIHGRTWRLEVERAPPPREAVERAVAQPPQRRQLPTISCARRHWLAVGIHPHVHIDERVRGHERTAWSACLAVVGPLHQRRDQQHAPISTTASAMRSRVKRARSALTGPPFNRASARPRAPGRRAGAPRRSRSAKSITSGTPSRR